MTASVPRMAPIINLSRRETTPPKLGDKAAWAPRIAAGKMYEVALKGKGGMPAKGGNPSLSDADVKAAVDYMLASSK